MKACPFCAEEIQDQAIKCRFCGEWLEEQAHAEPTAFDVWLMDAGPQKIATIAAVRSMNPGMKLKVARDIVLAVASSPQLLFINEDEENADWLAATVRKAGATVEVQPTDESDRNEPPGSHQPNLPKCPTCGSTSVRRISGGRKAARVATIGVFAAPKAMKSYECLNCRARW